MCVFYIDDGTTLKMEKIAGFTLMIIQHIVVHCTLLYNFDEKGKKYDTKNSRDEMSQLLLLITTTAKNFLHKSLYFLWLHSFTSLKYSCYSNTNIYRTGVNPYSTIRTNGNVEL